MLGHTLCFAPRPRRSFRKRAWIAGGGIALFLATLLVSGAFIGPDRDAPWKVFGRDCFISYCAGTLAGQGRWEELHHLPDFMRVQNELAIAAELPPAGQPAPWLNPPFYASAWVPLASLPYAVAWGAWLALSLTLLGGAMWMLCGILARSTNDDRRGWSAWGLAALLACVSMPAIQALGCGQNSCLSLFLLTCVVTLWRGGRAWSAGAVAGLLLFKPQLGAIVSLVLVLNLGWRAAGGLALSGGILLLITLIALPGKLSLYLHTMPGTLAHLQQTGAFVWNRHVTFGSFWQLLLADRVPGGARLARWLAAASQAGVAAFLAAAVWRGRNEHAGAGRDRLISATIAAMPLLMPYYVDYDLLLLSIPAVLFGHELADRKGHLPMSDRRLVRLWVVLYLWLYAAPATIPILRVNFTTLLLTGVALMQVARVRTVALVPARPANRPCPAPAPAAAA